MVDHKMELVRRCIKRLEQDVSVDERLKLLRVLASTAQLMADELNNELIMKELDNA